MKQKSPKSTLLTRNTQGLKRSKQKAPVVPVVPHHLLRWYNNRRLLPHQEHWEILDYDIYETNLSNHFPYNSGHSFLHSSLEIMICTDCD